MSRICFISLISPRKKLAVFLSLRERLFLISLHSNDCFLSRFARTIVSNEMDKERTCLLGGGAGRSSDRSGFLGIERASVDRPSLSMLFYFLTCEGVCFIAAEDENLTVMEDSSSGRCNGGGCYIRRLRSYR